MRGAIVSIVLSVFMWRYGAKSIQIRFVLRRIVVESEETICQEYFGYTRTGALIFCHGDFVFLIPFYIGKAVL